MVFSTSGFQNGAIEYASKRGIATVKVQHGHTSFNARSAEPKQSSFPPWVVFPDFIGWFRSLTSNNNQSLSLVESKRLTFLTDWYVQNNA